MSAVLAGVAILAVGGAIAAVAARDGRLAIIGLVVALVAAPFVADPPPEVRVLALRVLGAVLASYLLWPAIRAGADMGGSSRLGWPAETVIALGALIVGWSVGAFLAGETPGAEAPAAEPGALPVGPFDLAIVRAASPAAAGLAMIALAAAPVVIPRHPIRLGFGLLLLVNGMALLRSGMGGLPEALEQLAMVALTVGIAAGVAALTRLEGPESAEPAGASDRGAVT